ncbi:xanthine dehydrogenase family protein molybdopterin-binding subunit [Nonomuraea spiralis]|uniref:Xanthine dehydrogenase family protein molybdopterin-binding subunit n=1 Tax=Nonomuraea spiralis TaxID=46182 RepID=A0ABV5I998_9ACTN|nr:xanthine dehydrogenase family protein molybdopterin-binding subunit [Nonomuraea spiralis]GGS77017.1 carbon-monoxide dehydrogenase large subunit [Nonomuraea spiralis]
MNAVGRPVARVDGVAKVTGAARYAADVQVPGVTHAVLVGSTIARGRVTAIEVSEAAAATGVLGVFTHENLGRLPRPRPQDFLPLQDDLIRYAGQPVAAVVARTLEQARHAAGLVAVSYRADTPRTVLADGLDAAYLPPQGPDGGDNVYVRGDVEAALTSAPVTVEATYTTPMQHHNPMELPATVAAWDGDRLTVHESTQNIAGTQEGLMTVFRLPREKVRVISPYVGGGFGAKGTSAVPRIVLAAALARHVGHPVRLVLTRAESYTSNGHRAASHQVVRVGATRDGRLTAIDHTLTQQVAGTEGRFVTSARITRILYACPNVRTTQRAVALDLANAAYIRAPDTVTSHALESALDELSYALGLDPVTLRIRNWSATNQQSGVRHGSNHLRTCYERGAERFGWWRRAPRPGSMRDGDWLLGWGMATVAHTAGGREMAGAEVIIGVDGAARIRSGTHDIGTGTSTVMRQLGADVLGLPMAEVRFDLGDSAYPQAPASSASATVPCTGAGVVRAATAARDQVVALAVADESSPLHGLPPARVRAADGHLFDLDRPARRTSFRDVLRRHGRPLRVTSPAGERMVQAVSTGAVFTEVAVHRLLGQVRVRRVVGVYDPGRVLNERTARSQAVGGVIWGIGVALSEHTLTDPHLGRILTPNLSGYLVPVAADVPDLDLTFIDRPDPASPALGARGFGEAPTTGLSAAIGNAVHHAIGHRVRDLPITQDKVLAALA